MLAKRGNSGRGFKGKIDYLYDGKKNEPLVEKEAQVICHSLDLIAPLTKQDKLCRKELIDSFITRAMQHENFGDGKTNYVKEHILSFTKRDKALLTDNKLKKVVDSYIKDAGIDKTQYIAITHNDTNNFHVHILFNKVKNDFKLYDEWKEKIKTAERGVSTSIQYDLEIIGDQRLMVNTAGVHENRLGHDDIKKIINDPTISEARNLRHLGMLCELRGIEFENNGETIKVGKVNYKANDLNTVFYKNRKPKEKPTGNYKKGIKIIRKYKAKSTKPKDYEIKKDKRSSTYSPALLKQAQTNSSAGRKGFSDEDDEDDKKRKRNRGLTY